MLMEISILRFKKEMVEGRKVGIARKRLTL